jgi:hypothetical protein
MLPNRVNLLTPFLVIKHTAWLGVFLRGFLLDSSICLLVGSYYYCTSLIPYYNTASTASSTASSTAICLSQLPLPTANCLLNCQLPPQLPTAFLNRQLPLCLSQLPTATLTANCLSASLNRQLLLSTASRFSQPPTASPNSQPPSSAASLPPSFNCQLPSSTASCLLQLPAASLNCLLPPSTACCLPQPPAASFNCLLPPSTTNYLTASLSAEMANVSRFCLLDCTLT